MSETNPFAGARVRMDCVSAEARGPRDLLWCWAINEPALLEYRGNSPVCSTCDELIYPDAGAHTFIANIRKPIEPTDTVR